MGLDKKIEKMYLSFRPDLPDTYRWENERDRFGELCFCILLRTSSVDAETLSEIIKNISEYNLLKVDALGDRKERGNILASLITSVFVLNGVDEEDAEKSTAIIRQIAKITREKYDGKIQRLIRKYGNEMLEELQAVYSIDGITKEDVKSSLALWLQNTMEMPITLSDDAVKEFCDSNNIGIKDLEAVADKLEINLAVIDDLIQADYASKAGKKKRK